VVCEIMNDDGTMARRNDLITFAQRHGLKIGTIADLIAYRRRYDSIVRRLSETTFDSILWRRFPLRHLREQGDDGPAHRPGEGRPGAGGRSRCACTPSTSSPTALGQRDTGRGGEIEASMREIAKEGRGVIVLIREPPTVMLAEQRPARGERIQPAGGELRDYGVGAQILIDLGVKEMVLQTKHKKASGSRGFRPEGSSRQKADSAAPSRDRREPDMSTRTEPSNAALQSTASKGRRAS
jgi:3,4-dihydroxy 2-butanone 4-phosphate synthase/GTP cyclohydrolase II